MLLNNALTLPQNDGYVFHDLQDEYKTGFSISLHKINCARFFVNSRPTYGIVNSVVLGCIRLNLESRQYIHKDKFVSQQNFHLHIYAITLIFFITISNYLL